MILMVAPTRMEAERRCGKKGQSERGVERGLALEVGVCLRE
jgi:hypothetical protein